MQVKGTGVALITPFLAETHKIDYLSLEKIVNHCINGGLNYLVVLGTTAETPTLTHEEQLEIANVVREVTANRLPLVIGAGGNNTQKIVDFLGSFDFKGYEAVLSANPSYNKPSQEGIYQHYKAIAQASPKPILLYNVPSRAASNINAQTVVRLANDFTNVVGIKEASGNFAQCADIYQNAPKGFALISGDDSATLPLCALGAVGLISVLANAYPAQVSQLVNECLNENYAAARTLHYALQNMTTAIFEDGNPSGIKYLMHLHGLCQNELRLPLVPANHATQTKIKNLTQDKK